MKPAKAAAVQTRAGGIDIPYLRDLISAAAPVDLVVLPELCHLPYFPLEELADWQEDAVELKDPFVQEVGDIAREHECFVVLPLFLNEGEARFNAAVLIGPDGSPMAGQNVLNGEAEVVYRKAHLCDVHFYGAGFYESAYFGAGDAPILWQTPFGTVGILICYDRHFPEAWRTLRAAGADIVCVPIASPVATEATFLAEMQAMALQQGVFVIMANRAGSEVLTVSGRSTEFLGRSAVIGPDGVPLAVGPARTPGRVVVAGLDPAALERTRSGLPLSRHRRPDTYSLEALDESATKGRRLS